MSFWAREHMRRYWNVPWLRRRAIQQLRREHVARWSFHVGDVVLREWCGLCGTNNHYGIITRLVRGTARVYANVRLLCHKEEEVELGTLMLTKPLPPYPKEVLDLRHEVRKAMKQNGRKPSNNQRGSDNNDV